MRKIYLLFIIFIITSCGTSTAQNESGFIPITSENVDQLEFGYALPSCGSFSPDGSQIYIMFHGLYDILTGERLIQSKGDYGEFNPDGTLVAVDGDGVYEIATGQKIFSVQSDTRLSFLNNGEWIYLGAEIIYDIQTWNPIIELPTPSLVSGLDEVSPNGKFASYWGHGVYDLETGEQIIDVSYRSPDYAQFSPDSSLIAIKNHGVYDLANGQQLYPLSGYVITFSPDSSLIGIDDGIADARTGELIYPIEAFDFTFNSDTTMVAAWDDAVYNLEDGSMLFEIEGFFPRFSPTETFLVTETKIYSIEGLREVAAGSGWFMDNDSLVISRGGVWYTHSWEKGADTADFAYLSRTNANKTLLVFEHTDFENDTNINSCLIYGIKGINWPYRSGIIQVQNANVFDGQTREIRGMISGELIVFAFNPELDLYRIDENSWISASDVEIISMPDAVPIETP